MNTHTRLMAVWAVAGSMGACGGEPIEPSTEPSPQAPEQTSATPVDSSGTASTCQSFQGLFRSGFLGDFAASVGPALVRHGVAVGVPDAIWATAGYGADILTIRTPVRITQPQEGDGSPDYGYYYDPAP